MNSTLGRIAVGGLGIGIVSLSLAWALGGSDIRREIAERRLAWRGCDDVETVAASGPERRLAWKGGDTIEVVTPVPVRLIAGSGSDAVLRGPSEAIAHLGLRGKRLLSCGPVGTSARIEIELPARALRHVRISGAGDVVIDNVDQRELSLAISGSGQMQARGTAERVSATISGSGDVRLGELATKRLDAKISGSGRIEAAPKDDADITLSGAGTVQLLSRPASLHSKVSGAGRILQPPIESADKK